VWEGSGNVNCLDVLRALAREPESREAFVAELERGRGADRHLDAALSATGHELDAADEAGARRLVERLALVLQASLLVRHAPAEVADAFCAARLGGEARRAYGTLPPGVDAAAIVERHRPLLG
jgi:putative acyl-CoA dehydrogenase